MEKKYKYFEIPEISLKFLAQPENSTFREQIFKNKFKFDFQIAATHDGSYLYMYERDIDRDGIDMILEFKGKSRPVQLKTIIRSERWNSSSSIWRLDTKFLRPTKDTLPMFQEKNLYNYRSPGLGGALILQIITYNSNDSVETKYLYFDYLVLDLILNEKFKTNFLENEEKLIPNLKILSDKIIQESGRVDIKYSYLLDLYNEPRRILSLLGFEAGETPCGINSHLTALKSSDSNDGMMREHYFRLQSIFGGKQLLDPED